MATTDTSQPHTGAAASSPSHVVTTNQMGRFVHLHTHSHYSLLQALPKVKALVKAAIERNMPAVALTDAGNMYGAIEFYKECQKQGIKPILGVDFYVATRTRHDKEPRLDNRRTRLIMLAKNVDGYRNLIKLVTDSYIEGFYYKPRIDKELIEKYKDGLIVISPSFSGELAQAVKADKLDHAREITAFYKKNFGDDFYIEITHHPEVEEHAESMKKLVAFARAENLPLVAAHDTYYIKPEDKKARDTLVAIQDQFGERSREDEADFSFISQETAEEYFKDIPDALDNTKAVADKCNLQLELGKWLFPDFIVESGRTADDELRTLAYAGLERRQVELTPVVQQRLDYELDVIMTKGYSPYFLVVADLLRYAHEHGILTNIRGSVAGSMTTFLTGITNVNPIEYKLPFERFLNPERPSAPDIDMDFADNRRDQMIDYARQKYGNDKVAQIGTFGTMMARGAVRDVARAMGYPYTLGDRISKLIPMGQQGFAMTIERALVETPELKEMYDKEAEVKAIIDMAKQIEGCARHISVHAAGVVISPVPLTDIVPLQLDPKGEGRIITQYDMRSVDENNAGLLKFDFLGIKNLSQLADAINLADIIEGVKIDLDHIPLDDKKTFEMLARGETEGLFQLNGSGMTRFLKELKPTTIHDINAMVALYRPGPMETIPEYIRRKNDPRLTKYEDPRMEKYLKESFGLIVYQDDLLFSAIELAGYSWLEADKFRKAVGKKIREEMAAQKEKLTAGIIKNGQTKAFAEKLWKLFEPFQAYGFNKCITADTLITDTVSGQRISVGELYTAPIKNIRRVKVGSLATSSLVCEARPIEKVLQNGVKKIYTLTTRSGREIRATENHPFFTFSSWKNLSDLKVGERIATPRVVTTASLSTKYSPKKQQLQNSYAATLGYLISEGNLCHPHGIYFYSTQENEVLDFIKHAQVFSNTKITIDTSKATQSVYSGQEHQRKGNELMQFIKEQGLHGKTATQKCVPPFVYGLNKKSLGVFLAKMWQGDGAISVKNQQAFYATSSKQLAHDMQHLLLRLGILSTIHHKKFNYRGDFKYGYTVVVSHFDNLQKLFNTIHSHLIGKKKGDFSTLVHTLSLAYTRNPIGIRARGTTDTIPSEVVLIIKEEMARVKIDKKTLAQKAGVSERLLSYDAQKVGYQRETILRIATVLKSEKLKVLANSDIFWDSVVSIKESGKEMTYDLTVSPHHNFIANDIVVHNSHAASYGQLAYQTAYMKANFPPIYMAAVLTGAHGDVDEISVFIGECKRMGIDVLAPHINESFGDFTVIKGEYTGGGMDAQGNPLPERAPDKIRFGLYSIKNFGEGIANVIIEERKKNGPFVSLEEFLDRIKDKNLNKKSLEALVKSGAMDIYGDRGVMLTNTADLLEYNKEQHKRPDNQDSLFAAFVPFDAPLESMGPSGTPREAKKIGGYGEHLRLKEEGNATQTEKLAWEKELLGLYISGHPLDKYKELFEKRDITIAKVRAVIEQDATEFAEKVAKEQGSKQILDSMDEQMEAAVLAVGDSDTSTGPHAVPAAKKEDPRSAAPKKRFNKEEYKKQMAANQPREREMVIAGIIEEAKEIATKKDPAIKMMFLKIADFTGSIEVVVFPKTYELVKGMLKQEACVAIKGKTSSRNGTPSLILDTVKVLK